MFDENHKLQTLPNQIRSRELWLVRIVLSCPRPTLGCVLCTRWTQLCAAEIRGAVCQRYISFVYSLDRLFAQYLFAALSYFDVSVYSQIVEQVDTPTSTNHKHYVN